MKKSEIMDEVRLLAHEVTNLKISLTYADRRIKDGDRLVAALVIDNKAMRKSLTSMENQLYSVCGKVLKEGQE